MNATRTLRADQIAVGDTVTLHGETGMVSGTSQPDEDSPFVALWVGGLPVCLLPHETVPVTSLAAPHTSQLPDITPDLESGEDGWDWMTRIRGEGWETPGVWGSEGWDLGLWPYVVVAHIHLSHRDLHGLVTYVEGDVYPEAYGSREELWTATARAALGIWSGHDGRPRGLSAAQASTLAKAPSEDIPEAYRRPYSH
ncbi:hypothetical protein [Streptomyces sp. NBRC 109706]|uniref:hypothetical protein n=1 Tax=Streptomyces sp. NBRC 109706 TaxID=1550035 RepID=UPI000783B566|nr:hypothetical protein [Streptomyces sp. NBRC 109706]